MRDNLVILGGARTPMAEYNGSLKDLSALDLGTHAAKYALSATKTKPEEIDHVVFGNALQTSADAIYGARHVGLRAGIPIPVPALTINRLCGSGFQAIVSSAHLIIAGEAKTILCGGMESMSQAPHVVRGARTGFKMGNVVLADYLMESLMDSYSGLYMAQTAEKLAKMYEISREEQDGFALRSQKAAAKAYEEKKFDTEIAPVVIKGRKGDTIVDRDDHMKPDTTLESLSKLKPAFSKDGCVTAGNASGIVDGAAAIVLCEKSEAKKSKKEILGYLRDWNYVGIEPDIMGFGPVPAISNILDKNNLKIKDIDLFEINEAFAAQYLSVEKALGLDREKVNVNGGAIALGHPLAATGTRLVLTLLFELKRRKGKFGIASACIGGGQGMALLLESV